MFFILSLASIILRFSFIEASDFRGDLKVVEAHSINEMKAEFGLKVVGVGGGLMYGIERLNLSFQIYRDVTLEEARDILVGCVEIYCKNLDQDKKIRPYLAEYPFPVSRLELFFSIDSETSKVKSEYLKNFHLFCGGNIKEPIVSFDFYDATNSKEFTVTETYLRTKELVCKKN
jgi:hypothetical protein